MTAWSFPVRSSLNGLTWALLNGVAVTDRPKPKQDEKGRFVAGNGGGGRKPGTRNKLGEAFLADLMADWEEHGVATLRAVRETKPSDYVKVVASVLPKQLNVKVDPLEDMTDDQLRKQAQQLMQSLGPVAAFISGGDTGGDENPPGPDSLN